MGGPIPRRPPRIQGDLVTGNGIAFLGDSITQADAQNSTGLIGSRSYGVMACMRAGGRLRFVRNAGVSGDLTSDILARLDADVIAYNPNFCLDLSGTNNIGNLGNVDPLTGEVVTQATTRRDKVIIWNRLRAAGIQPIAATLTPRSATTGTSGIELLNAWIRAYAARHGMWVVDLAAATTDPATFGWLSGGTVYNSDGVHPNAAGSRLMAAQVVSDLAGLFPNAKPYLDMFGQTGTTGANMLKSGCFQQDTNADGVSDNWTKAGDATNVTHSRVLVDGGIGYAQRAEHATAAQRYYTQVIPSGPLWSVGDRIAFTGKFTTTGIEAGGLTIHAGVLFTGGAAPATIYPLRSFALDVTRWVFYAEAAIPVGTTALDVQLVGTNAGPGTVEWEQPTLLNLTTLGIV